MRCCSNCEREVYMKKKKAQASRKFMPLTSTILVQCPYQLSYEAGVWSRSTLAVSSDKPRYKHNEILFVRVKFK